MGMPAGDGGLVAEVAVRPPGGLRERRPVVGEQGLVGSHQMLAVAEGGLGERPRSALGPADQLDHDIDGGEGGELPGIVPPVEPVERETAILAPVA